MTDRYDLMEAVLAWLRSSAAVACARFTAEGELLWANDRFHGLVPSCAAGARPLAEMVVEGQRDDVRRLLGDRRRTTSSERLHLVADGSPVTLLVTWLWDGDELVLLGEAPVAELEAAQLALTRVNLRATELARENVK